MGLGRRCGEMNRCTTQSVTLQQQQEQEGEDVGWRIELVMRDLCLVADHRGAWGETLQEQPWSLRMLAAGPGGALVLPVAWFAAGCVGGDKGAMLLGPAPTRTCASDLHDEEHPQKMKPQKIPSTTLFCQAGAVCATRWPHPPSPGCYGTLFLAQAICLARPTPLVVMLRVLTIALTPYVMESRLLHFVT